MRRLGFDNIIRTVDGEEMALGPDLRVAIHVEISITDGPGGDSALVVSDGTARLREPERLPHQTTSMPCAPTVRSTCTGSSTAAPSGTRWCTRRRRSGCASWSTPRSTASSPGRCATSRPSDARAVVPSAGPPAFLDPELFRLNVITGDELSIFPDQRSFMQRLADAGPPGILAIPGTDDRVRLRRRDHASPTRSPTRPRSTRSSTTRPSTSASTRPTGCRGSTQMQASWHPPSTDLLRHAEGVVGAAAGDGADAVRRRCR